MIGYEIDKYMNRKANYKDAAHMATAYNQMAQAARAMAGMDDLKWEYREIIDSMSWLRIKLNAALDIASMRGNAEGVCPECRCEKKLSIEEMRMPK